jgi:hypothetical protein
MPRDEWYRRGKKIYDYLHDPFTTGMNADVFTSISNSAMKGVLNEHIHPDYARYFMASADLVRYAKITAPVASNLLWQIFCFSKLYNTRM